MIICPNCNHKESAGALFCSECGAQLVFSDGYNTSAIQSRTDQFKGKTDPRLAIPTVPASMAAKVMVYLVDFGQFIPVKDRSEFTLGRISEGQPIMPDIDLTSYKAYENGVSRLHAVVKQVDTKFFIMDLGSANGTYINGYRLAPNTEVPVDNRDIVSLGKLKFQIILNN